MVSGRIKKLFLYAKCMKNLLLSHHPSCQKFEKHTINIKKYKFCIGCYIGYPTAILGIIFLWIFKIPALLGRDTLLIWALILISAFILSPLKLTAIKFIKIIQKMLIGLGSSFLFWFIWSLPNAFLINLFYFILVFGFLITLLNLYHALGMQQICKNCKYFSKWGTCPGFQNIIE